MAASVLKQDPNTKSLCAVLWLDEGDFPKNLHIVGLCHNK